MNLVKLYYITHNESVVIQTSESFTSNEVIITKRKPLYQTVRVFVDGIQLSHGQYNITILGDACAMILLYVVIHDNSDILVQYRYEEELKPWRTSMNS